MPSSTSSGDDPLRDAVILGSEWALASSMEASHHHPGPSPLAGVRYPDEAIVFWRWVEAAEDEQIRGFLADFVADDDGRAAMRASLRMADLNEIVLFAKRSAFAAIRTGSPARVVDAFDALSAIDVDRIDWRDLAGSAQLAAFAWPLDAGLPEAVAGSIGRATPDAARMLDFYVHQDKEFLSQLAQRVVSSPDGPVLVDDYLKAYHPTRDLVPVALAVAAAIEAEGTNEVDGVTVGAEVIPLWIGGTDGIEEALAGVTGCVMVRGHPRSRASLEHFLLVLLAEAASAEAAAELAAAAEAAGSATPAGDAEVAGNAELGGGGGRSGRPGSAVVATATGRLVAIVVAASAMAQEPSLETRASLARFIPLLQHLLPSR